MRGKNIAAAIVRFLGSRLFFWFVITLFVLQALWVALSFRYPMIYDERFHFGLIKIYSHHLSPIIANQPHSYDAYRDLFHEGSHFYHYLMAFPYRFIEVFTHNEVAQIIFLRLLNIAMLASGIVLFGRLFRKIGIQQTYINVASLFFALLPLIPLIGATINYDNMLVPLTALFLLCGTQIIQGETLKWQAYAGLIVSGCVASLVQFQFLPIFATAVIYLAALSWKRYSKKFFSSFTKSVRSSSQGIIMMWSILGVVFVGLFSQVYLWDTAKYHTPVPDCTQTMSKSRCEASGLVQRNDNLNATRNQRPGELAPNYFLDWVKMMGYYTTWSGNITLHKGVTLASPLPKMYTLFMGVVFASVGIVLYAWKSLTKKSSYYFLMTVTVVLTLAVYLQNYSAFRKVHEAVSVQPRYFLPVLLIFMVFAMLAIGFILRQRRWPKLVVLGVVLCAFAVAGAGASTHILQSRDDWYWQNRVVIKANHAAKKVLTRLVIGA